MKNVQRDTQTGHAKQVVIFEHKGKKKYWFCNKKEYFHQSVIDVNKLDLRHFDLKKIFVIFILLNNLVIQIVCFGILFSKLLEWLKTNNYESIEIWKLFFL